ncbi:MAG: PKD domain-containing protein [Thermoplasmata archaeon]|nr:MAG: PKD domain-containing protein [Thermoplasmata archaeon]
MDTNLPEVRDCARYHKLLQILLITFVIIIITTPAAAAQGTGAEKREDTTRSNGNTLPIPVLSVSTTEIMTLETLIIDASGSTDPDGTIIGYFFQFEDGTESGWVDTPIVEHVYLKERFYTIRLKVMDDLGAESSYWETITVNVKNRLPFIILEDEISVKPNTEVVLEGYRCWDEDGYIINYTWEFEDNTTLYGPNVTHIFKEPGIYNIFLTVLDDDRKTNKSSLRVVVLEKEVSSEQTLRGIIIVVIIAVVGSLGILLGRRAIPGSRRVGADAPYSRHAVIGPDAEFVQNRAQQWYKKFGNGIPKGSQVPIPAYAEPFIYNLALFQLHHKKASAEAAVEDDDETEVEERAAAPDTVKMLANALSDPSHASELLKAVRSVERKKDELTENGRAMLVTVLAGGAGASNTAAGPSDRQIKHAIDIYLHSLKLISKH